MALLTGTPASFNEKLLLSNGLSVSPMKNGKAPSPVSMSLREIVNVVDTQKDLDDYLCANHSRVPPNKGEPKYERHPVSCAPLEPHRNTVKLIAYRCSGDHLAVQRRRAAPLHRRSRYERSLRAKVWDNLLGTPAKNPLPSRLHPLANHHTASSNRLLARIQTGQALGCL